MSKIRDAVHAYCDCSSCKDLRKAVHEYIQSSSRTARDK